MLLAAEGTVRLDGGRLEVGLTVGPGELVALVGPNGAGKSTTLELLVGLRRLHEGRLELRGEVVDDGATVVPPHRRGLGWVPQEPSLLPRRRPLAQVTRFARGDTPRDDAVRTLAALGIDPDDLRTPARLSVGERQRVAVARSLVASDVVLLDEPTSAQDDDGARRIRAALRAHTAAGGAALVVAHRPEDAHRLADRLIVLERDDRTTRTVQTGTPEELAADPGTAYVARVVGATVLHGEVGDDHVLRGPWGAMTVADGVSPGPATAVVRPGAVAVQRDRPTGASPRNVLSGRVRAVHDRPDVVSVTVDTAPPLVASLTHDAAAALALRTGDEVWLTVKATDIDIR